MTDLEVGELGARPTGAGVGGTLLDGALTAQQWANLAVTAVIWFAIPLTIGLALVMRAEVK